MTLMLQINTDLFGDLNKICVNPLNLCHLRILPEYRGWLGQVVFQKSVQIRLICVISVLISHLCSSLSSLFQNKSVQIRLIRVISVPKMSNVIIFR